MIIGDYYVNNFLLVTLVLGLAGGIVYISGMPGMIWDNDGPKVNNSENYEFELGNEFSAEGSGVLNLVRSDGDPVSGAEIYVNGKNVGLTDEKGSISFEVPNSTNMTVSASTSDVEIRRVFEVGNDNDEEVKDSDNSDRNNGGSENDSSGSEDKNKSNEDDKNDKESENSDEQSSDEEQNESGNENSTGGKSDNISEQSFEGSIEITEAYQNSEGQIGFSAITNGSNSSYYVYLNDTEKVSGTINQEIEIKENISTDIEGLAVLNATLINSGMVRDFDTVEVFLEAKKTGRTGIYNLSEFVTGHEVIIEVYKDGEVLKNDEVFLDGDNIGNTNDDGAISISVPEKDQVTISTGSNVDSETFKIESDESGQTDPSIDLNKPSDGEVFETFTGENLEIELSSSVDIPEQGTYSLKVNGTSVENNSIKSGVNSIAVNHALSSGVYTWSLDVESQGSSTSSNIRNFEIKEIEPKEGLFIEGDVSVGNMINITLFQDDEPVEAEEIIVNGKSEGYTDPEGKLKFEVPDVKEIEISTGSGIDSMTDQVDGYESSTQIDVQFDSDLVSGQSNTLTVVSDGKGISNRPVYVDGEYEGETGSNGDLNFAVPSKDSFSVYTQVDGTEFNETFETSSPTYDVSLQSPSDGEEIDDYEVTFKLDLNLQNDAYINGYWVNKTSGDSNRMFREIVPSDRNSLEWNQTFDKADEYDWYVETEEPDSGDILETSSELIFETLKGTPEDETPGGGTGS